MASRTLILLGTRKGAFVLELDAARERATVRGPFCEAMPIQHLAWDPARGALLAGAGSPWYGAIVWRSTDLGETWTQSGEGLTYGDGRGRPGRHARSGTSRLGATALYAGVEPAGLFRSDDGGVTWSHVAGLREHPSTPGWQPGAGGLILHSIVPHPTDPARMWVGISAVGVFHTADGGATWEAAEQGRARRRASPTSIPRPASASTSSGSIPTGPRCSTSRTTRAPTAPTTAALSWQDINDGLPSHFGFALAVHPHDPRTIWTVPLNGDDRGRYMPDGRAAVWMSRDEGATWSPQTEGLPQEAAYLGVLREAMAVDRHDPAGVYIGHEHGAALREPGRGTQLAAPGRLPARHLVRRDASSWTTDPGMAQVHIPRSLAALFPGIPRRIEVPAHDLASLILELDGQYPGLWDRLCEPGPRLRRHINAFVDGQPATLESHVTAASVVHIIPAVSGGATFV